MKISQELKNRLGTAGEYRVLSELLLLGIDASITTGNAKGTDIIVFSKKGSKYLRIEVKTSKNGRNFVTSYFPKYSQKSYTDPDFWVFYQPKLFNKDHEDVFYVLSHKEVRSAQLIVNKGNETLKGLGVDNIPIKLLESMEGIKYNWDKITHAEIHLND